MSKRPEVVLVDWEDSASAARWHRPEELDAFAADKFIASTAGFLVHEDRDCIVVAGAINSEGWYGSLQRIPKGMIRFRSDPKGKKR